MIRSPGNAPVSSKARVPPSHVHLHDTTDPFSVFSNRVLTRSGSRSLSHLFKGRCHTGILHAPMALPHILPSLPSMLNILILASAISLLHISTSPSPPMPKCRSERAMAIFPITDLPIEAVDVDIIIPAPVHLGKFKPYTSVIQHSAILPHRRQPPSETHQTGGPCLSVLRCLPDGTAPRRSAS